MRSDSTKCNAQTSNDNIVRPPATLISRKERLRAQSQHAKMRNADASALHDHSSVCLLAVQQREAHLGWNAARISQFLDLQQLFLFALTRLMRYM
jgi:hypothetical protein